MHRVEVRLKPHLPDARGLGLVKDIHDLGITTVSDVRVVDIYWLEADLTPDKLELVCQNLQADPVIQDHPRVKIVHTTTPIGQRAATNLGVAMSRAKYVMKLDAHCSVDDGFDVKMMGDMQHDWTMIPHMHRLHVFDWRCQECGQVFEADDLESASDGDDEEQRGVGHAVGE